MIYPNDLPDHLFPQTKGKSQERTGELGGRKSQVIISCVESAKYDLIVINPDTKKECVHWNNREMSNREKDVIQNNWKDFCKKGFPSKL